MSPASAPRLQRVAVAVVVVALTVGLGTVIGTELGHRRADDRLARAKEEAKRERAIDAAEAREEREEGRREREREAPEKAFDDANNELLRAARAGRRDAVARQEARLTQLARRLAATQRAAGTSPKDPYERELDRFPIKQRPLFAQQISSGADDHVLFVSVSTSHFCLKSASERRQAVRATYQPIASRLRQRKIDDFELLVVPLGPNAPRRSDAFARAGAGTVSLTSRGQSC